MTYLEIEKIRINKVNSLFSDKVENEKTAFLNLLKDLPFSENDKATIRKTLEYACCINYDSVPLSKFYVTHPIRVASLSLQWQKGEKILHKNMIIAALIHNCLEKSFLTKEELAYKYGVWVANTIGVLTVDRENQYKGSWLEEYYKQVDSLDTSAQMLKVLDKYDNIFSLCLNPDDEIRKKYLEEIEKYILPKMELLYAGKVDFFKEVFKQTVTLGHKPKSDFGYS